MIVSFVRSRGKVCIAIGDGANDVNMIRVGIDKYVLKF
jgi:magnesium-transporting ATPase (P-type)